MSDQPRTPIALLWMHKLSREHEEILGRLRALEAALATNKAVLEQKAQKDEVEIQFLRARLENSEKGLSQLKNISKEILELFEHVKRHTEQLSACSEGIKDIAERQKEAESVVTSLANIVKGSASDSQLESKVITLENQVENLKSDGRDTAQNICVVVRDMEANKAGMGEIREKIVKLGTVLNKYSQRGREIPLEQEYNELKPRRSSRLQTRSRFVGDATIRSSDSHMSLQRVSRPMGRGSFPSSSSPSSSPISTTHNSTYYPDVTSAFLVQNNFRNCATPVINPPNTRSRTKAFAQTTPNPPSSWGKTVAQQSSNLLEPCRPSSNIPAADMVRRMSSLSQGQTPNNSLLGNTRQSTLTQTGVAQQLSEDLRSEPNEGNKKSKKRKRDNTYWTVQVYKPPSTRQCRSGC